MRDVERGFVTVVLPIGKILEEEGVMKIDRIGNAQTWCTKAEDLYRVTANAIKKNPHVLCKIISQ